MPLIIPPGFAQCVFSMELDGDTEPQVCTLGLNVSDSGGDYQAAANKAYGAWATEMMPVLCDVVTATHATLYVGQDGTFATVPYDSDGAAVPGGQAGEMLPSNCAVIVQKRTGIAGRRGRGRMYVPGVLEDSVDHNGTMATQYVTDYQTTVDQFMAYLLTDDPGVGVLAPVVLHRSEGAGVEPAPTPITSFNVVAKIGTQRQRMRR